MAHLRIDVKNEEEQIEVQRILFSAGIGWVANRYKTVIDISRKHIFVNMDAMTIFFRQSDDLVSSNEDHPSVITVLQNHKIVSIAELHSMYNTCRFVHSYWMKLWISGEDIEYSDDVGMLYWYNVRKSCPQVLFDRVDVVFRVKPVDKYIKVNGIDIVAPIDVKPSKGEVVYAASISCRGGCHRFTWSGEIEGEKLLFENRLLHRIEENAKVHSKAMLSF